MYRQPAVPTDAPSPVYLRAAIGGVKDNAGLAISPDIPASKLGGALSFAPQARSETPLVLVDTSVMLSGKAGMLVTDRAVYFDNPRARVPLEVIVHPPTARSAHGPATLPTAMGPVALPDPHEASTDAMHRALRAIAFYNRGASRLQYAREPVPGPVGELAAAALRHPELAAAPMIPAGPMHAAANAAHGWLDHDAGEELLALLDETAGADAPRGVALTDRRVIVYGDNPGEIHYGHLTGVSLKTGVLSHTLQLVTGAGARSVETSAKEPVARAVADFLARLGSLHPAHRQAWPGPGATADDPSGAVAAARGLSWPDLRVATLLELIHAQALRGAMGLDAARDLVVRAVRLQRTLRGGHGRTGTMPRTPLSATDFEVTLRHLLGRPAWEGFDGAARTVDFELGRPGSALGTVASNVVGLGLLAVVGVGWVSLGSGGGVQRVRARIWEGPGGAGFSLTTPEGAPIARESAKLGGGLLASLAESCAATLLRRALLGWEAPFDALARTHPAELDQRARALVPHADVAPFFSG